MRSSSSRIERQANELERAWSALGRFFLSRRAEHRELPHSAAELSPVQLHALRLLADGPVRIGELSGFLGLAESSTTRMVDRLESLRLARRVLGKPDRRSVQVELTAHGRRVADQIDARKRAFLAEMLAALEPDEREQLVRLMHRVAAVLREREDEREAS